MHTKKIAIAGGVFVLLLATLGYFIFQKEDYSIITDYDGCVAAGFPVMESYPEQCRTPDGRSFTRIIVPDMGDLIRVSLPQPGRLLFSPGLVAGEARGSWYFEASFPVKLIDANGLVLVETYAQAQSDWMTEEFVPFKSRLEFKKPATETGTLILKNDNPSGDPARDKEIRIPVRFTFPKPKVGAFNTPITLGLDESAEFPGKFFVILNEINDSRCKPNVQCVWQGELQAKFSFIGGDFFEEALLGTVNRERVIAGDSFDVELKSATETTVTIVATSMAVSISGYIHVGPTCPVERFPANPNCADRPFPSALIAVWKEGSNSPVAEALVEKDGRFMMAVPPGSYRVTSGDGSGLPRCQETTVKVVDGKISQVDISCDSGIR